MGRINDIERAGNMYYIVDDMSNLYVMDSNFILLRHKNVKGRGSGEVGSSYAIRANNEGLLVFDSENLKFVESVLTVQYLREECGLNGKSFSARFKKHTGRHPRDYIVHHRIEMGKILLRETDLTVTDIAMETVSGLSPHLLRHIKP